MNKDEFVSIFMQNAKECLTKFRIVSNDRTNAINASHALGGYFALATNIWNLGYYDEYVKLGEDTKCLREKLLQISAEGTTLWENQENVQ